MSLGAAIVELTREELYKRVWSTPMSKLAADFGLSDVGLAKVCKRHKIPSAFARVLGETGSGQEGRAVAA